MAFHTLTFVTTGLFYTVCSVSAVQHCLTSPTCLGPGSRLHEHHGQEGAGHRHRDPLARGGAAPEETQVQRIWIRIELENLVRLITFKTFAGLVLL